MPRNQESSQSSLNVENINLDTEVLKGTHLLVEIKEIQARYLNSPHFKDIYLYLSQNKLPTSRAAIRKVENLAERYILLDSILFKIT